MRKNQIIIKCLNCQKEFSVAVSTAKAGRKYCSKVCLNSCPIFREKCRKNTVKLWKSGRGISPWKNGLPLWMKQRISKALKGKPNPRARNNPQLWKKGHIPWNKGKDWKEMRGKNHHRWKGGKTVTKDKYIKLLAKEHPNADCYGYVLRSRLIAEKCIGRYLQPEEVIHHIDHQRTNDVPENLYLFSSNSDHRKFHADETLLTSNLKELKLV